MVRRRFRFGEMMRLFWDAFVASRDKRYVSISPARLERMLQSGRELTVVDCREPGLYEASHITGARSMPYDVFMKEHRTLPATAPVVLVCYVGMFSRVAASKLCDSGYTEVLSLRGGMKHWDAAHITSC